MLGKEQYRTAVEVVLEAAQVGSIVQEGMPFEVHIVSSKVEQHTIAGDKDTLHH